MRCLPVDTTVNEDSVLIQDTLRGSPVAFGRLVEKYQDRLYNTMLHFVGDAEETLDVVQEAFIHAYLNLKSFQGESAFYTWLYRIAFNIAATYHRRKKPVESIDRLRAEMGHETVDPGHSPTSRAEREERSQRVRQVIATLSEDHRAVLVLRDLGGYTYEEIAQILDIPIGTVRSRLHRARLELREKLKGSEYDLL